MSKINRSVAAIKQVFQAGGILLCYGTRTTKRATQYLLNLFSGLHDCRVQGMIQYPLKYIILLAFLAILAGANTWQEIHDFGQAKKAWLKKFLDVKKYDIPSHDTFCRVFGLIEHNQLQSLIVGILIEDLELIKRSIHIEMPEINDRHLCIDGKEATGTGRKYKGPSKAKVNNINTLHIYDSSNQICLFSEIIDDKTNEIPVAQEILQTIDLKNTICTFDALHMQRKTIEIIHSNHGHYVGGLKGNQARLHEVAEASFSDEVINKLRHLRRVKKPVYIHECEQSHGNLAVAWEYFLIPAPQNELTEQWSGISSFIMCKKYIHPKNPEEEVRTETRYYASDLLELEVIAEAIRSHWLVEEFHWHLDVSFSEDENSTMNKNAFENLSLVIKLCLHLFLLIKTLKTRVSVRRLRLQAAWNIEQTLEEMLTYFDVETITQTLANANVLSKKN